MNPKELLEKFQENNYIIDSSLALIVSIAIQLNKPILLNGLPGCGKTQLAETLSYILNNKQPIRLQCYEGITVQEAMYDFNYKKQLLYIETIKQNSNSVWVNANKDIYSEEFLSPRPLLKAITSEIQEVVLIDEIDKSDEEFEAFLLEILSQNQITIPEIGTIKSKTNPIFILTSNNIRELSDPLLRRCIMYHLDMPTVEKEMEIVCSQINIDQDLAYQAINFVQQLRKEDLKKIPSISETIDWCRTLILLNVNNLDINVVKNTLNLLLKHKNDLDFCYNKVQKFLNNLPKNNVCFDIKSNQNTRLKDLSNILKDDQDWNF